MDLSAAVLGQSVADQLQKRIAAPVLTIGKDRFTRQDLAGVACFNFIAAQNLSRALTDDLAAKDTRTVYDTIAPRDLCVPRLGAVALAVLGAAFEAKGIGGDTPLESWVRRHTAKEDVLTTFGTMKTKVRRLTGKQRRQTRRKSNGRTGS